ncbi:MAG: ParB/RepB/Spo0J family partition protein [Anaerolineales bacterium]|nr:ParB/RepB/Spo0J family partition protein [Anaerolineales bacterium]MDD5467904.1 ParB/RepB/Spo0J family partition protein [Anaerolineales bacterium]
MARRPGLGKGLEALIPGSEAPAGGVVHLSVDQISPNPRQPRSRFAPEELAELADSIREHGVLQPLVVSYDASQGRYTLIAGERRLLAARTAGMSTVPAIVREVNDEQRIELALVENLQRTDLSPLEAAEAYRQLAEEFHLSHEEISARVGKSRAAITNTLRLLKLPAEVKQALVEGRISEGHARTLLALPGNQAQLAALRTVLAHELNVRQTEELVRRLSGEKPASTPKPAPPPEIKALADRLRQRLGTKVVLNPRPKGGGTLVIHYYSNEELDELARLILGE